MPYFSQYVTGRYSMANLLVCMYAAPPFHADQGALKELRETFGYGEGFLTICLAYCNNDAQQVGPDSGAPAKAYSLHCAPKCVSNLASCRFTLQYSVHMPHCHVPEQTQRTVLWSHRTAWHCVTACGIHDCIVPIGLQVCCVSCRRQICCLRTSCPRSSPI